MEKIWLNNYPKGVPSSIEDLSNSSITDLMRKATSEFADNTAFTSLNSKLSYKDIDYYSSKFGAYLQHELSLEKGCKVAIMLPNLFTYPVAVFGCYKIGATVVNLNPLYKGREIENALNDSKAETIIVLDKFIEELNRVIKKTKIKKVIVCKVSDLLSWKMSLLVNVVSLFKKKSTKPIESYIPFVRAISNDYTLKEIIIMPDDIALLQYTGGTTG